MLTAINRTLPLFLLIACSEAQLPADTGLAAADIDALDATPEAPAGLVLNELLADSAETEDWIELYNPTSAPITLDGYALTDALGEEEPWALPEGLALEPGGHLLIWCDDAAAEAEAEDDALHAPFKLSKDGEGVALLAPDGGLADEVALPASPPAQSWGRPADGATDWVPFAPPTPAAPNANPTE